MRNHKKQIIITSAIILTAAIILSLFFVIKKNNTDIKLEIRTSELDEQSYWNPDIHGIAKAENGYYYLARDNMVIVLKYFDKQTNTAVPVCAKAECTHTSKDCNARFDMEEYLNAAVYYYRDNIYMVKVSNGMARLVCIKSDGSERKEVADIFANDLVSSISMVFHGDYVYAYDHLGHTGSGKSGKEIIKKINIYNGNSETVFEYEGTDCAINGAKSFGDKLFFKVFGYSTDKQTLKAKMDFKLYCYDYNTGESSRVSDMNIADYYVDSEMGVLYYFVIGKGLYSQKLNGENNKLLYAADENMVSAVLSYDGKYIYMGNGGIGSTADITKSVERMVLVLDTEGNIVNTITLGDEINNLYFGDENYLFVTIENELAYIDKSKITEQQTWSIPE